jgi:hypothetical protein
MSTDNYHQRQPGTVLMWCAAILLLGLAAAQGAVSWKAQYNFVFSVKREPWPSALEAGGLDAAAIVFAMLGLARARMGHPAKIERTMNVACALGSAAMNVLSADLGSPRSVVVFLLPATLYSAASDRLIATAAHAAGVQQTSLWRWVGVTGLYLLRLLLAFPSTARGLRSKLLESTPLPAPRTGSLPAGPAADPVPVRVPLPTHRQVRETYGCGPETAKKIRAGMAVAVKAASNGHAPADETGKGEEVRT